jgi:two-component system sensor histidine kinase UhpB
LSAAAEVALYRIAVESLTNVVRHAAARHCVVVLSRTPTAVTLRVADDGRGIAAAGGGFGLASMRQRAAELGGTFDVATGAPRGTTVNVSLPAQPPRGGA